MKKKPGLDEVGLFCLYYPRVPTDSFLSDAAKAVAAITSDQLS